MDCASVFRLGLVVLLAAAAFGCAGLWGFEPLDPAAEDGGHAHDTGGLGQPPGDSGGDGGEALPALPYGGLVDFSFAFGATYDGGGAFLVSAWFEAAGDAGPPCTSRLCKLAAACSGPIINGCCLAGAGPGATYVQAGDMAVSDAVTNSLVPLVRDVTNGGGAFYTSSDFAWNPGDTLNATATGDAVSSFSGSIVAPSPFANAVPPFDGTTYASPLPLVPDQPLTVGWNPGAPGDGVTLVVGDIVCTAEESAGSLTVPATLMSTLSGKAPIEVEFARIATGNVVAENAVVEFAASATAIGYISLAP